MLLDTSLLIDVSLGRPESGEFVDSAPPSTLRLHPVAIAEVLVGARDRAHLRGLDELISRFGRVRVDPTDFDHALHLTRQHALSHGIGWPDCLIAATALRLGVPVATLNVKHFKSIKGLKVVAPY